MTERARHYFHIGSEVFYVARKSRIVGVTCAAGHAVTVVETVAGVLFVACDSCEAIQVASPDIVRLWKVACSQPEPATIELAAGQWR